MKTTTLNTLFISIFSIAYMQLFAQSATCDGVLPFEEQNGLLTIEMESGNLPSNSNWQMGSEPDPNLAGATINYIFWDGPQSFSALSGAPITYNIKINNPGTYRLAWRGRIGTGTSRGEHNDAWLRIVADDFYATRQSNAASAEALEPRPSCNSNPDRDCPEGSSTGGFFKAFMNRSPTGPEDERWGFVTNTNDGNSFRFIWATFNTAGNYSVIVDARSNFFFMDKMVLRRTDVSDTVAFNLSNNESSCATLSLNDVSKESGLKLYPNPAQSQIEISNTSNFNGTVALRNILGATIREFYLEEAKQTIDVSDLKSGVYILTGTNGNTSINEKFIKL